MSPAVLQRVENNEGKGWASCGQNWWDGSWGLHTYAMPSPGRDGGFQGVIIWPNRIFAYTAESFNLWVPPSDRRKMHRAGLVLRTFFCPPGTFHIGHEQAVFERASAIVVAEEPL